MALAWLDAGAICGISIMEISIEHWRVVVSGRVEVIRIVEVGVRVVGVPVIIPVEGLRLRPAGRVPEVIA